MSRVTRESPARRRCERCATTDVSESHIIIYNNIPVV